MGAYAAPAISAAPKTQTAEEGSVVSLSLQAIGSPVLRYQWYFNGNAINGATNSVLRLSAVSPTQLGLYTVVVQNEAGDITSTPAMLNVVPPVERRPVPGINLVGEAGSVLTLEYANELTTAPDWLALATVSLIGTSAVYFDVTTPPPPQRFYRAWQTGTPSVPPSLRFPFMVPALTLTGSPGGQIRVDGINQIGRIDAWFTLDTVTLTNTSQLFFDVTAPGQPARLYRLVPVP